MGVAGMSMEPKSKHRTTGRFADPRIVELQPRARWSRGRQAPVVDPLRQREIDDDRLRMQQNIAAAIVIVLLTVAGAWVIDELRTNARILACVEAGHHDCVPLDRGRTRQ
jgi:hypothetical protein